MPLIEGRCKNCRGIITVNPAAKRGICEYCDTPYFVEDVIHQNITNIGKIHVSVKGNVTAITRIDAAEAFMKLKKYDAARKAFREASEVVPQYYQVWWGQIRAITREFTQKIEVRSQLDELRSLYESALLFVPKEKKKALSQKFKSYYKPLHEQNLQRCEALRKQLQELQEESDSLDTAIEEWEAKEYFHAKHFVTGKDDIPLVVVIYGAALLFTSTNPAAFAVACFFVGFFLIYDLIICPYSKAQAAAQYETKEKVLENLRIQRTEAKEKTAKARQELGVLSG